MVQRQYFTSAARSLAIANKPSARQIPEIRFIIFFPVLVSSPELVLIEAI
jgi:hypothetical protein